MNAMYFKRYKYKDDEEVIYLNKVCTYKAKKTTHMAFIETEMYNVIQLSKGYVILC